LGGNNSAVFVALNRGIPTNKYIFIFLTLFQNICIGSVGSAVGADIISIDRLRELQVSGSKDYIIVDVASAGSYNFEHISGAINIPQADIKARSSELPLNKLIITYCHCGVDSSGAKAAAEELKSIGFEKVAYLGVPYKNTLMAQYNINITRNENNVEDGVPVITAEIVYAWIKNHPEDIGKNFIVIDVRTKKEYDEDHISSAINMPLKNLQKKYKKLPDNKEIYIYVYGDENWKSSIAVRKLIDKGYNKVYRIEGDYTGLKSIATQNRDK